MLGWNIFAQSSLLPLWFEMNGVFLDCFLHYLIKVEKFFEWGKLVSVPSLLVSSCRNRHDGLVEHNIGGWLSWVGHHLPVIPAIVWADQPWWATSASGTRSVHRSSPCWVASKKNISHLNSPTSADTKFAETNSLLVLLSQVRFLGTGPRW